MSYPVKGDEAIDLEATEAAQQVIDGMNKLKNLYNRLGNRLHRNLDKDSLSELRKMRKAMKGALPVWNCVVLDKYDKIRIRQSKIRRRTSV